MVLGTLTATTTAAAQAVFRIAVAASHFATCVTIVSNRSDETSTADKLTKM